MDRNGRSDGSMNNNEVKFENLPAMSMMDQWWRRKLARAHHLFNLKYVLLWWLVQVYTKSRRKVNGVRHDSDTLSVYSPKCRKISFLECRTPINDYENVFMNEYPHKDLIFWITEYAVGFLHKAGRKRLAILARKPDGYLGEPYWHVAILTSDM